MAASHTYAFVFCRLIWDGFLPVSALISRIEFYVVVKVWPPML